jgi:hypothetical protein
MLVPTSALANRPQVPRLAGCAFPRSSAGFGGRLMQGEPGLLCAYPHRACAVKPTQEVQGAPSPSSQRIGKQAAVSFARR